MKNSILFAFTALSMTACQTLPTDDTARPPQPVSAFPTVSAGIIGPKNIQYGIVDLTQGPNGLIVRVEVSEGVLTPGWHGMHLHQIGDCSDIEVFKRSGGHVGKIEGGHGLLNPAGPEAGDTPNIYAHSDGVAVMEFVTNRTSLAELQDEDGSALIIHAGPDDHITQPIGGAGARVACAVIE